MNANSLIGYRETYEDHAADFMDDLFGDVEQSLRLQRDRQRPIAQEIEEETLVVSLVKVDIENIGLPLVPELAPAWSEPPLRDATVSATAVPETSSGVDKFFLGTALASMILGASVVLGHYTMLQRSAVTETPVINVAVPPEPIDSQNVEFSSEIKTALQTATTPAPPALPESAPAAATPAPAPQTVVQYVPLFNPPPAQPPTYSQPPQPPQPPVYANPQPAPSVVVPVIPNVVAKAPDVQPMPSIGASSPTILSGLFMLEPNDRSYALIEANGNVQSVPVGGAVGSTGWKLKSVNQQNAVLEKNGQSRSVAVGQKF